jgi:anti-sigma regulatory factor (Ser/Thr protein kinase)
MSLRKLNPGRGHHASRSIFHIRGGARAPAEARAHVAHAARDCGTQLVKTLQLLVSEIVTNSVLHGKAQAEDVIEVVFVRQEDRVRVEVLDAGPGFEPHPVDDPERPGGFGLGLVESFSERWGILRDEATCVWFELASA